MPYRAGHGETQEQLEKQTAELAQIRKELAAATGRMSELSAAEDAAKRLAQQEASRVQQLTADLTQVRKALTLLPAWYASAARGFRLSPGVRLQSVLMHVF